jgi:hypothetical protein
MPGGGHSDAAAARDTLGMRSAAKGAAAFLLSSDTSTLTMAVYGPWGRGKVRVAGCEGWKRSLLSLFRCGNATSAAGVLCN